MVAVSDYTCTSEGWESAAHVLSITCPSIVQNALRTATARTSTRRVWIRQAVDLAARPALDQPKRRVSRGARPLEGPACCVQHEPVCTCVRHDTVSILGEAAPDAARSSTRYVSSDISQSSHDGSHD